jgi:hypothetical protein
MTTEPAPTPKRRGRPPKPRPAQTNPDCTNEACLVTCHPDCPNLHSNREVEEWRQEARAEQMGNDPTIRSTDVL